VCVEDEWDRFYPPPLSISLYLYGCIDASTHITYNTDRHHHIIKCRSFVVGQIYEGLSSGQLTSYPSRTLTRTVLCCVLLLCRLVSVLHIILLRLQDGESVRVRRYPWGTVEVEQSPHSDVTLLRRILFRTHTHELVSTTNTEIYEKYRSLKLQKMGFVRFSFRYAPRKDVDYPIPRLPSQ
jgi:hypothetical protein